MTLNLTAVELINLYNKEIIGLTGKKRYYLTTSKWTDFNQYLEDAVSTFGFKAPSTDCHSYKWVPFTHWFQEHHFILTTNNTRHDRLSLYDILWAKNSVACLGSHPTEDYGVAGDDAEKLALIAQQCLRSKI